MPLADNRTEITISKNLRAQDLVGLIMQFAAGRSRGNQVRFILPGDENDRYLLRVWKFPQALERATGIRLWDAVDPGSRRYFGNADEVTISNFIDTLPRPEHLNHQKWNCEVLEDYFALRTFKRGDRLTRALPNAEMRRWCEPAITNYLDGCLYAPTHTIATHILFEALANAVGHAEAETVQMSANIGVSPEGKKQFHLSVWDDGVPIPKKLRDSEYKNAGPQGQYQVIFNVHEEGGHVKEVRPAGFPSPKAHDGDWLLSAFYPGLTINPKGDGFETRENPGLYPGMGLYILLQAATFAFRGIVVLTAANWKISLAKAVHQPAYHEVYDVWIIQENAELRPVHSNQVQVVLPFCVP
ncbi:ATP-binding protein [Candidatus Magnetaquicoccus inordinatus]|uniref:ATP-binding protein n=1 Tax=Candidatus Magnetaquicoccus inordinatus TaxID=2496818 RepID=UPI00102B5317|nr:ATP-binding protein [Candidatus Magnetaquicoccus inordinatus]